MNEYTPCSDMEDVVPQHFFAFDFEHIHRYLDLLHTLSPGSKCTDLSLVNLVWAQANMLSDRQVGGLRWDESCLKSAFKLSKYYHRLQF